MKLSQRIGQAMQMAPKPPQRRMAPFGAVSRVIGVSAV